MCSNMYSITGLEKKCCLTIILFKIIPCWFCVDLMVSSVLKLATLLEVNENL